MYLKKLEIFGFKSFADRCEFAFEPGITCIVGPNGCGKSNVVDAVKWVLGEQSPKSLRGDQMADVIFNGAEGRQPQNYAEVSLLFDNESRLLNPDYPEILITRRLTRAGESEYLLNKTPCRLKDIRDIFLDTGVGVKAYSIVEQGRIDSLLSANSVERRVVFEEAAGISKYKVRRAETLRKLEHVEANVVRLTDIVEEVNRQLRSTRRQASIARRYREYSDKIRDMRVALAAHQYKNKKADETVAQNRCDELDSAIGAQNAKVQELSAAISQTETELLGLEHAISDARARLAEVRGEISATEGDIRHDSGLITELRATEQRLTARKEACKNRRDEIARQLAASQNALSEAAREYDEASARLRSLGDARRELETKNAEGEARLSSRKADVVDIIQRESKTANELSTLDTESRLISSRRERLAATQTSLRNERDELSARSAALENRLREEDFAIERRQKFLGDTKTQIATETSAFNEAKSEADRLSADLTARRSKAELLTRQEAAMEGVREGVRSLVAAAREGAVAGVEGPVANLIEVDVEHSAAVEGALGERAQWLLAATPDSAVGAVSWLKERGAGRATLLSLDTLTAAPPKAPHNLDGVVARASDLVRCDEKFRPAVEFLLNDVIVARDLRAAVALSFDGGRNCRIVTLDGELVEPRGVVTGGTKTDGIISRRSELRTLSEQTASLQTALDSTSDRLRRSELAIEDLALRDAELKAELETCNMARGELLAELDRVKRRLAETIEEIRLNGVELEEIEKELASKEEKRAKLAASAATVAAEKDAASRDIAQLEQALQDGRAQLAENAEALTAARVRLAQLAEKRDSAQREADRLAKEGAEAEKEEADTAAQLDSCTRRIAETEAALAAAREKLAALRSQCEAQDALVAEKQRRREEVAASLDSSRSRLAELNSRLGSLRDEHETARLALAQVHNETESIVTKIRDDYHIELVEKLPEFEGADVDYEMLPASIEELKEKLERMGNVNLSALDELQELETRSSFLGAQMADLQGARNKLQDAIRTINRESRVRFEQTFEVIREHFKTVFRQLFGGGKADITLEEGQDVLEAGVEIVARPPGKEMRTITLLSGGEKVLTAIAVLFALFKARPSPFAILDEVDAALDDNNIGRFLMILRQFSEQSQFLIISHNKQTMSAANVLYGITMQQSGISKKIAVKFEELESQVA